MPPLASKTWLTPGYHANMSKGKGDFGEKHLQNPRRVESRGFEIDPKKHKGYA